MLLALRQASLIAAKDTRIFFKDRFAVVFAFLFPLMFVLGFTLALSGVGPEDEQRLFHIGTLESDGLSAEIIAGLSESTSTIKTVDYDEALRDVEAGKLSGFVAFPADFTQSVMTGAPTRLEVVVSEDRPGTAAALRGFAASLAGRISNTQIAVRALAELTGSPPDAAALDTMSATSEILTFENERIGEPAAFNAANFTLPGYLTMFVFFAAALSAELIARERQNQTLERLLANGARQSSVILGKYLGAAYKGGMQLAVLWVVGIFAFDIDLGAAPAAVILISVLMVLASSAFGVLLASFVNTVNGATSASVLSSLVLAPVGGCWWPLFIVPDWMQTLAKLTPHGWANTGFNKLMLFGGDFGDVTLEMAALVAFGVAFLVVALWRFRLADAV